MSDDNLFYEFLYRLIQNKQCFGCNRNGPNFKTPCNHYFHLACLASLYHETPLSCPECRQMLRLDFIKVNEKDKCFSCSSETYLQKLDCSHFYCALCLLRAKPALECCKSIQMNYFSYILRCSLCEDEVSLTMCSTETCKHGIICKKCHNYSFLNQECIGKCGKKVTTAYVSNCFSCGKDEVIHFSTKKCQNECKICINCYSWFLINYGLSDYCYICSELLFE